MKILLATNFSDSAHKALHLVKALKKHFNPQIHFIHVIHSFWEHWFGSSRQINEIKQRLENWQTQVDDKDTSKLYVEKGNVADRISSRANAIDADLIILGTKTHQTGRYKTAATMEGVIKSSKRSVFVVKQEQITKILCGIDGSQASMNALKQAAQYAERFSAELHLIHALPAADFNPLGLTEEEIKEKEQAFLEKQQAELEKTIKNHIEEQAFKTCSFHWSKPANAILNQAEDEECDLIVIGAQGHSPLYNMIIGSTAEKVVRFTPCSLLVVH